MFEGKGKGEGEREKAMQSGGNGQGKCGVKPSGLAKNGRGNGRLKGP